MRNGYSAECFFCDDIRQEVGDKYSYMGVYTGEVILDTIPYTSHVQCSSPDIMPGGRRRNI